ncbi:hypothetical protein MLD38_039439 [Melastoma candidum]|uniref:Uncharacterized protein n=1 Tax=Melastoma candidum TaxID=119954 RepID=A0ACB9L209_9MYRT|nr:hypothetical protein MLD38_039439 [Melastoma candidum]
MEPLVGNNEGTLLDRASDLDNAGGVRAEEECYCEIAPGVEGEVKETFGSFGVSADNETGYQHGEGEGKVAENEVQVGERDLGLGFLAGEVQGADGDSFLNVMGNGNNAAASVSLEVPMGAVEEEHLHDETGELIGDEGCVALDQGIKVAYEQCVGEDGEIDKIEVSGDGISLFVEFSGPATNSSGFHVSLMDKHEDLEVAEKNEEHGPFDVGDVVWVKTKSQSWWPGKILDPSGAEVDITEATLGHLLVAYLGGSHVSWSLPSELKAFNENYSDMLKQNKSRNFTGAVDKAVHEFGKRVMEKLTSKREKDLTSLLDEVGECCSTLLKPREFLLKLKSLAVNLMRPDILDFSVMMNYLMAFYCSIGHENKPMYLLLPEANPQNDANEIPQKPSTGLRNQSGKKKFDSKAIGSGIVEDIDAINLPSSLLDGDGEGLINGKSGTGPESRSRKKSKYLSYPYVNYGNRELAYQTEGKISSHGPNEAAVIGISMDGFAGSPSIVKLTRKKSLRTHPKKLESSPDILSFRSDEFLTEIGSLALDCVYSVKSDKVHMVKWFSYKLRNYLFHDQHIYDTYVKNLSDQKEDDSADTSSPAMSTELKETIRRRKRIPDTEDGNNKMKPLSGLSDVSVGSDTNGSQREGLPDLNSATVLGSSTSVQPKKRKRTVGIGDRTRNATEAAFDHEDHMSYDNIKQGAGKIEAMPSCNGSRNKNKRLKSSEAVPQAADHGGSSLPDLNGHHGTSLPSTFEIKQRHQKRRKEVAWSNSQGNGNSNPIQDALPPSGSSMQTAHAAPQLDYIKQNLQTVTNMLGSSRGNLSPEVKAQLEGEIKSLLDKVSGM